MVLGHDITTEQRTQDVRISADISFDTMLLKKPTVKGLKQAGFLKPSPIQLLGIPLGKCGLGNFIRNYLPINLIIYACLVQYLP